MQAGSIRSGAKQTAEDLSSDLFLAQAEAMAHGTGQIQEAKPGGRQVVVEIAFHLNHPVKIVAVETIRLEKMRGVFQRTKFPWRSSNW